MTSTKKIHVIKDEATMIDGTTMKTEETQTGKKAVAGEM